MSKKKDNREEVFVNFDRGILFKGLLAAHEMDITFNEFVELTLREYIEKEDKKYEKN